MATRAGPAGKSAFLARGWGSGGHDLSPARLKEAKGPRSMSMKKAVWLDQLERMQCGDVGIVGTRPPRLAACLPTYPACLDANYDKRRRARGCSQLFFTAVACAGIAAIAFCVSGCSSLRRSRALAIPEVPVWPLCKQVSGVPVTTCCAFVKTGVAILQVVRCITVRSI